MTKPTLVLTVGLPYSGKSTWARSQGHPIVSPDAVRLALHGERYLPAAERMVWTMARYLVDALFRAGHDVVILDATNNTRKRREEWESSRWKLSHVPISTPENVCIERATAAGDDAIIPVIQRMADEREPVTEAEVARDVWI